MPECAKTISTLVRVFGMSIAKAHVFGPGTLLGSVASISPAPGVSQCVYCSLVIWPGFVLQPDIIYIMKINVIFSLNIFMTEKYSAPSRDQT